MKSAMQLEMNGSGNEHVNTKHKLHNNIKLNAYRRCERYALTPRLRDSSDPLCCSFAMIPGEEILKYPLHRREDVFYPGKIESFEWRVYTRAVTKPGRWCHRSHTCTIPPSVIVWWSMSYHGATQIQFCEQV